jgi:CDP-glucose 4,6-dehydratase
MAFSGRRVLLTGHTGFKGSWLLLWLKELNAHVWGYALEPEPQSSLFSLLISQHPPTWKWHNRIADLSDFESLNYWVQQAQPEVVFHLAAQPLVRRSYTDPLGTWATNVQGSLNLLEALKPLQHPCAVVMVTTDKVYENREWPYGYREPDRLGGHDPYSASKAAAEIAIASWRASFCGTAQHQTPHLRIASARAGNVIGGGDWAADRIVPDSMRALAQGEPIAVRNPTATRPWQHVLEPLSGYLRLAEALLTDPAPPCEAFNFGPYLRATARWVSWWRRSSATGQGSGLTRAIRVHPTRPASCTCRSTRPITASAGSPAGTTPPPSSAPWAGIAPCTRVPVPWSAACPISRPTKRPLPLQLPLPFLESASPDAFPR